MNIYHHKQLYVFIVVSLLLSSSGLRADERLPAREAFSEGTKEFLSDPARTGSLLGSILAGAAVANPFAPLLGSVAGFMIGKSSAFTKSDANAARREAYLNRSLVPEEGLQITTLSGLSGKTTQASEPTDIPKISELPDMESLSDQSQQVIIVGPPEDRMTDNQVDQTAILEMPKEEEAGNDLQLQKQLAYACSNVPLTQQLSPRCYYLSQ